MKGRPAALTTPSACAAPAAPGALLALAALALSVASCGLQEVPDWETFYERQPRSILVVPVVNETTEVEAPRFFMATIAKPLVESGYYVFPVEGTAEMLESEGFTAGEELLQVRPASFGKYFGADGVLFVTLKAWDTSYLIFWSNVVVTLEYRLVDTRSGETVWEATQTAERSSSGPYGSGLGDLIVMAVDAALTAATTDYVPLARQANENAVGSLIPGPYHPEYQATKDRLIGQWRDYREALEREKAEATKEAEAEEETEGKGKGKGKGTGTGTGEEKGAHTDEHSPP
jgi:hypothetical protein